MIVGAYPSSLLEPTDVPQSLMAYGVLSEEQAGKIDLADCTLAKRQGRVREFNKHVKAACAALRWPENELVTYMDVFDELVDPESQRLKPAYLDISTCNIHVVWESTIMLWLQRLPWLKERVPPGFEARMQDSLQKYLRDKELEAMCFRLDAVPVE